MTRHILIFLLLITGFRAHAGKEFNHWYFGNYAGLDFTGGAPVYDGNSLIHFMESCAAISDTNGNLLFYTDGDTVVNANHQIMVNGTGLMGGYSASQGSLIIRDPAAANEYYIFTVAEFGFWQGFRYSKVDMNLQGGLGEVTQKNIALLPAVDEKLTAVKLVNGGYWIIVHALSPANAYFAYPLTSAGLGAPVVSNAGVSTSFAGYLRVSPDGSHLAHSLYNHHGVEICDFDTLTGIISNPQIFYGDSTDTFFGIEFSQTGRYLYAGTVGSNPGKVYQLDMQAGSIQSVFASAQVVGSATMVNAALQRGPDQKIYISHNGQYSLGVIVSPDSGGTMCNYAPGGLTIPSEVKWGLPNLFTEIYVPDGIPPKAGFYSDASGMCEPSCVSFTNTSDYAVSYQWFFPGGNPSSSTDPDPQNICYSTPGNYDVMLIAVNASGSDTVLITSHVNFYSPPSPPVITRIGDTLFAPAGYAAYQWYLGTDTIPGATSSYYLPTVSTHYGLMVTDTNGCTAGPVTIDVFLTSVEDVSGDRPAVYPNPANEKVFIHVQGNKKILSVALVNSIGETVLLLKTERQNFQQVPITEISPGIYFLQIYTDNGYHVEKLLIE